MRSPPHFLAAWERLGTTYFVGPWRLHTKNTTYWFVDGVCTTAETRDGRVVEGASGLRLIGWLPPEGSSEAMRLSPDFSSGFSAVLWRQGADATQDPFLLSSASNSFHRAGLEPPAPPKSAARAIFRAADSLTRIHSVKKA